MIPVGFQYERAATIDEALAKLSSGGKLIAGGHSLVPLMKLRLSEPGRLIDISRIPALSGIREAGGAIEIGATTVHHQLATSSLLQSKCPVLSDAAAEIGDPQVRNRGTIGGSLAHADPAADLPAAIIAADAELVIQGTSGQRRIKAPNFFLGFCTVALAPTEIILSITCAPAPASAYAKLHQRASHYAIVGVAAALDIKDGVIQSARVGLTGATTHAIRLGNVEQALAGQKATREAIAGAAGRAADEVSDLNADLHASADYRRAMIPVFTRRALEKALSRA